MPESPSAGSSGRYERVFLLRVWREPGGARAEATRGSIVEVGTDRRFFFTQLADLKDFLSLRLAPTERGDP